MMRQECNSRLYHHQNYYNNHQNKSAIFLPILCSRPSIKDVQVKRKNKVVVFPNPTSSTTSTTTNDVKYSKLRRFFSGKNLAAGERGHVEARGGGAAVSVADLDPPLPVVKRPINPAQQDEPIESLWKRRSGGATTLKSLQLQRVHHPAHHLQPTTV